jgi:hypothetical protein
MFFFVNNYRSLWELGSILSFYEYIITICKMVNANDILYM